VLIHLVRRDVPVDEHPTERRHQAHLTIPPRVSRVCDWGAECMHSCGARTCSREGIAARVGVSSVTGRSRIRLSLAGLLGADSHCVVSADIAPGRPGRRVRVVLLTIVVVALLAGIGLLFGLRSGTSPAPAPALTAPLVGPLHTQGNQLMGADGRTVLLRGAQVEGYNVANRYKTTPWYSSSAFSTMHSWGMNEVRLPFSGCLVAGDPGYLPGLVTIAHRAEAAGLFVVLAMFDDKKAGCEKDGVALPHVSAKQQWAQVAAAFRADTAAVFDLFNEPHVNEGPTAAAWSLWKHGGTAATDSGANVTVVGMDELASAIRGAGALVQPLVAEPLGGSDLTTDPSHLLADRNALYSKHTYFSDGDLTADAWNSLFGNAAAQIPVYIGEWAFLPNGQYPGQCKKLGLSTAQATSLVLNFMRYMESRGISYNVWSFTPTHLVVDEVRYTPTTLPDPMVCDQNLTHAGMGSLYKQHLQGLR
jgi:hypothetical protein